MISSIPKRNYLFKVSNCKRKNRVWKLFLIKTNVNGAVLVSISLTVNVLSFLLIIDFEQAKVWKDKRFWRQDQVYFSVTKIHYQIAFKAITLHHMNQWEIFAKEFTSDVDSGWKDAASIQNDLLLLICLFISCFL